MIHDLDARAEAEAAAVEWLARELGTGLPECPLDRRLRKVCKQFRYGKLASVNAHGVIAAGGKAPAYRFVSVEDRQRHARKKLDKMKLLLQLRYDARKFVTIDEACRLVGARPRTLHEWAERGLVKREAGMVYLPDLRKHVARKLQAA